MTRSAGSTPGSTPEPAWRASADYARVPALPLPDGARVCVVSAHPDDDVLAVGGLLQRLDGAGRVDLVRATDGEGSHPGSPTLAPDELARVRRSEVRSALGALGTRTRDVHALGLPDSGLAGREAELGRRLRPLLAPADVVLCPWRCDGHPDHEAVGRAVASVRRADQVVWEYPVWAWRWARPETHDLPWSRARAFWPTATERDRKRRAVRCFGSQVGPLSDHPADRPVLDEGFLAHFDRDREVVLA